MTSTRFATFNVHSGKPRDRHPNVRLYRESVVELDAHVIGLQEVDNGMARSARVDMAGEAANAVEGEGFFANARRRWDGGKYGNALVVRGVITNEEVLRYPRKKFHYERRIAQLATVTVDGTSWNVANTHLSLRGDEHLDQLRLVAEMLGKRDGPRVLLGDFNLAPEAAKATLEPLGWTVLESGFTFPSWEPDHTVDFICVQGAVAERVEVKSLAVSDHAAVIADLVPS